MSDWVLMLLGVGVGFVGTLIGAGGGFVLAPVLLLLHPGLGPEKLSALSLAVVAVNATVGSIVYWREGRVDVRSGLWFAAAAIPMALAGVYVNSLLPHWLFAALLGVLLVVGGSLLLVKPLPEKTETRAHAEFGEEAISRGGWGPQIPHDRRKGIALAGGVGVVSSVLGIGGGIVHVPAMVFLLRFPVHFATATSHFVLALTAWSGVIAHAAIGSYEGQVHEALWLAGGVVIGSPLGAKMSGRLGGATIVRALAVALVLVGVRVLWSAKG